MPQTALATPNLSLIYHCQLTETYSGLSGMRNCKTIQVQNFLRNFFIGIQQTVKLIPLKSIHKNYLGNSQISKQHKKS